MHNTHLVEVGESVKQLAHDKASLCLAELLSLYNSVEELTTTHTI
jgi:hypothetical protein